MNEEGIGPSESATEAGGEAVSPKPVFSMDSSMASWRVRWSSNPLLSQNMLPGIVTPQINVTVSTTELTHSRTAANSRAYGSSRLWRLTDRRTGTTRAAVSMCARGGWGARQLWNDAAPLAPPAGWRGWRHEGSKITPHPNSNRGQRMQEAASLCALSPRGVGLLSAVRRTADLTLTCYCRAALTSIGPIRHRMRIWRYLMCVIRCLHWPWVYDCRNMFIIFCITNQRRTLDWGPLRTPQTARWGGGGPHRKYFDKIYIRKVYVKAFFIKFSAAVYLYANDLT